MEANRITAPRRGSLRTVVDRLLALGRRVEQKPQSRPQARPQAEPPAALHFEHVVGAVDLLAHVDSDLRFIYVSDASLRFIGYHREYLETITLHELVAPADVARLDALLVRASASGYVEKATLGLI